MAAPRANADSAAILEAARIFLRAAAATHAAAVAWPRRLLLPPAAAAGAEAAAAPLEGPLLQVTPEALVSSARWTMTGVTGVTSSGSYSLSSSWARMLSSELSASLHLPLQRAAGHVLSALLRVEQGLSDRQIRSQIGRRTAEMLAGWNWPALCGPVLAARALITQIEGQLWVRNGDDILTDCHYYNGAR
jgi:hypothetical protein